MAPSPKRRPLKSSKLNRTEKLNNDPVHTPPWPCQSQSTIPQQDPPAIRSILILLLTVFGLNLARTCCLLALHPLFGSIASTYYFETGVQSVDFLVAPLVTLLCPNLSPSLSASNLLAAFLVWRAPDSLGRTLAKYSNQFHILHGPLIFQSFAYWPIRLAGMSSSYQLAAKLTKRLQPVHSNKVVAKLLIASLPVTLHGVSRLMLPLANMCFKSIPPSQIFNLAPAILLATTVVASMIEISQFKLKKTIAVKKINVIILLGCVTSAIYLPFPQNLSHEPNSKTESTRSPAAYRTLARRLSSTGLILVGEFTQESGSQFRFLRCDHSLLGGVWNGLAKKEILKRQIHGSHPVTTDELETQSVREAEAIYPTFIVQTAVRLVERSLNTTNGAHDQPKALILGLGVGISARCLMNQDVVVTAVEIDPLVYEYSKKYFGLPTPNGGIFLEDARSFLDRDDQPKPELFDYVIHDVFTGGAVPSSLFTLECWRQIRGRLKDDGVLAVNFVGRPSSDAASMVFITLLEIFPFCRAFSEDSGGPISQTDYQNMVIFCSSMREPKFRKPHLSDVSDSSEYQLRILNTFQDREIDLLSIVSMARGKEGIDGGKDWMLRDKNCGKLDRAQAQAGLYHWEIMRQALPDHVWNDYYH